MIVLNYGEQIKESAEELLALEGKQTKGLLRRRVRFLRLLKTGECTTQAQAGARIKVNSRQSQRLWKKYRQQGVKDFLSYPFQGHKERISEQSKQALDTELRKNKTQSLQQACKYLEEQQGQHFSPSGMHYIFRRLHIKNKTGRPVHHQRDEKGAEDFKKKCPF